MAIWSGAVSMLVGGALSKAGNRISNDYREVAESGLPFTQAMSDDLTAWADKDWQRFKTNFQPVAEGLAVDAARGAENDKAEGVVSADVSQAVKSAGKSMVSNSSARGINPASGNFHAGMTDLVSGAGKTEGAGLGMARRDEEGKVFKKRMDVINANRGIPGSSNVMAGKAVDLQNLGARRYLGLSDSYAGAASSAASGAAGGLGKLIGNAVGGNKNKDTDSDTDLDDPDRNVQGNDDYEYDLADGGLIRGPGTGRSDSIPANVDKAAPARVSNGEYHVPSHVVHYFGKKYFDELQARYGDEPVDGEMVGGMQ